MEEGDLYWLQEGVEMIPEPNAKLTAGHLENMSFLQSVLCQAVDLVMQRAHHPSVEIRQLEEGLKKFLSDCSARGYTQPGLVLPVDL